MSKELRKEIIKKIWEGEPHQLNRKCKLCCSDVERIADSLLPLMREALSNEEMREKIDNIQSEILFEDLGENTMPDKELLKKIERITSALLPLIREAISEKAVREQLLLTRKRIHKKFEKEGLTPTTKAYAIAQAEDICKKFGKGLEAISEGKEYVLLEDLEKIKNNQTVQVHTFSSEPMFSALQDKPLQDKERGEKKEHQRHCRASQGYVCCCVPKGNVKTEKFL